MRLAAVAAVFVGLSSAALADDTVHYTLSPVLTQGKLEALAIEVKFAGDADGETLLELPNDWGGEKDLYQGIRDLQVDGDGVTVETPSPETRVIKHTPGTAITVRYRVEQYWQGVPTVTGDNDYRPIVQPTYFHTLGNAIFVQRIRDGETKEPARATFVLKGLPNGWSFASDIEHGAMGRNLTVNDVIESISVGGDFRVLKRGTLRVALRGTWSFTDDEFVDRLKTIIASHHKFWRESDTAFLVTVLPLESKPGQRSLGGTGRGDAFAFFANDNADDIALKRVLAHEHLHTWIPRRIGGLPEKDEARDYWLSEGFTDFYTTRLLIRDGVWSLDDYVQEANELLSQYSNSSARTAPNSRIIADFWNDPDVGKLPYQRGQLLATMWDARVRAASGGKLDLDDIVLAMKARAAAATGDKPPLASVLFSEEMKWVGVDVTGDMAKFVEKGEAVLLPEDIFAPCGKVATLDLPVFDRGFDSAKTAQNGNTITDLREDSPAYRAGLRNGMKIVKREAGKTGDSRVPLTYRVLDNGVERVITYKPEGKARVTLQEFTLQTALSDADKRACVAKLGGT